METLNSIEDVRIEILIVFGKREERYLIDDFDITLSRELVNLLELFKTSSEILSSKNKTQSPFVSAFRKKV